MPHSALAPLLLTLAIAPLYAAFAGVPPAEAPHMQQIQQSLQTALGQVQTLRHEVKVSTPGNPPEEQRIEKTVQAANSNLAKALAEQDRLQHLSNANLGLRTNPDFRALNDALSLLTIDQHNLELRISEGEFTQNKSVVLKDLAQIEKNLSAGIEHSISLNREMAGA